MSEPLVIDSFAPVRRRTVRLTEAELIKTSYLFDDGEYFPLVVEPNVDDVDAVTWVRSHRDFIESKLLQHGGLLFRNFGLDSAVQFQEFTRALSPDLLDYFERAATRREVEKNIYTSTDYPADQPIPLHHEMSYSHNWPMKIWFYCAQPAVEGGATPIANDRKVFPLIDPAIKEQFLRRGVMYVRNYGGGLDMSWQEAFQTEDREIVEDYCRLARMTCEWRDGDRLRTRAVRQVVATHPQAGQTVWFNHAHMFHISNVEPLAREALLAHFKEDELPRNSFYGDGSPIDDSVLAEIRRVYSEAAVRFPWQQGDCLLLDNFLVSHGREPFVGPRNILVAMAELFTSEEIVET